MDKGTLVFGAACLHCAGHAGHLPRNAADPAIGYTGFVTFAQRAGRREWMGLATIALPCAVYAMDTTLLHLALPAIAAELKPGAAQLLWMVDIYSFAVAGLLIAMGNLGDRIGRRRLLLWGGALFVLASLVGSLSRSADQVVLARALLGVAGATVAPSTLALIRNLFSDDFERRRAVGIWIASFSAGATLGPVVGGLVLEFLPWRAVFLLAVPPMLLLLVLGPRLLPEYRAPSQSPLDLPSAALSLAAVLGAVYAVKRLAELGPSVAVAAAALGGLAAAVAFAMRQRRIAHPLVDPLLLRQPGFSAALLAYCGVALALWNLFFFFAQAAQTLWGLSPLGAGLAMLPSGLSFVAGSLLGPGLAGRSSVRTVLVGGMALGAFGYALCLGVGGFGRVTGLGPPADLTLMMMGLSLGALGLAPVLTIGNDLIVASAPPERAGAASGLAEAASEVSGALGVAVLGSACLWWYRAALPEAQVVSLPTEAAHWAAARASIAATLEYAGRLGEPAASSLREAALSAFASALRAAAAAAAAVLALGAWCVHRLLPGAPPQSAHVRAYP